MRDGWRPTIGDHVLVLLDGAEASERYVIRGTSGDRILLHEVWCEGGEAREAPRGREIRWIDVADLRPAPEPEC